MAFNRLGLILGKRESPLLKGQAAMQLQYRSSDFVGLGQGGMFKFAFDSLSGMFTATQPHVNIFYSHLSYLGHCCARTIWNKQSCG